MEEAIDLKNAVSFLLKENKTTSELSDLSIKYINDIQDLINEGKITNEELKKEIKNHLKDLDMIEQGSVAQYLLGCASGKDNCSFRPQEADEIIFSYDSQTKKLISMERYHKIPLIGTDSKAIVYINGVSDKIDIETYKLLSEKGFNRVTINHRKPGDAKYTKIEIEDLKRHILNTPERISDYNILLITLLISIIVLIFMFK
jgi:hypothetical protein